MFYTIEHVVQILTYIRLIFLCLAISDYTEKMHSPGYMYLSRSTGGACFPVFVKIYWI